MKLDPLNPQPLFYCSHPMIDIGSSSPERIPLEPKLTPNYLYANDCQEGLSPAPSQMDAMNAQIERMERDANASAIREAALLQELDKMRRALTAAASAAIAATRKATVAD